MIGGDCGIPGRAGSGAEPPGLAGGRASGEAVSVLYLPEEKQKPTEPLTGRWWASADGMGATCAPALSYLAEVYTGPGRASNPVEI